MAISNPLEVFSQLISEEVGFPLETVRYVVVVFMGFPLALILRHVLHPDHTPLLFRYAYSMLMGIIMGLLCFGWYQMAVLFFIVSVSYLLLFLPPNVTQRYSMVWAMGSLSMAHLYRILVNYGRYEMDFTSPLMVMVLKIVQVAFALHDGKARKASELSEDQREQKIEAVPGILVYFSFMFNFHSFFAGPVCTVREYLAFMNGSNFKASNKDGKPRPEPSAVFPVLSKLATSLASLLLLLMLSQYVDGDVILDPQYNQPFRLFLNRANCLRIRTRYYFLWLLSESINNCAGLGFSGYDERGVAKWDVVTNLYIMDIELATSMRMFVNKWNALTALWLRRYVYERAPFSPTLLTFVVSAWWHGFYPGYYFTFIYIALVIEASRKMRRLVRPHFQRSPAHRFGYDVITWFLAHLFIDFGSSFDLMFASKSLTYWSYYYYLPLIISCVVAFSFPSGKPQKPATARSAAGTARSAAGAARSGAEKFEVSNVEELGGTPLQSQGAQLQSQGAQLKPQKTKKD